MTKSKLYFLLLIGSITTFLLSCNGTKSKNTAPANSTFIYNELIVSVKTDANILLDDFNIYELKIKKTINKRMGMYLLTYNTDKIAPEKMLEKVRATENVSNAEFNKNLTERDN